MSSKILKDKRVKKDNVLNDCMKLFCKEYLVDLNATQSYLRSYGESIDPNSAKVMASRLLTNVNIRKYINDLLDTYKNDVDVTVGSIVSNIKSIAFNPNSRDSDRIKASQLLAQYKGMLVEHRDITTNGSSINVTLED